MSRNPLIYIVMLAALGAASGCQSTTAPPASAAPGPDPTARPRVVVATASDATAPREELLPGTLRAWEMTALYSRVTGYLESVGVDIGDLVAAGDEVARIEVPEMAAELKRAKAVVARAHAELALARKTSERLAQLHKKAPEAIPRQDVDVAASEAAVAGARVAVAAAEVERLEALGAYQSLRAPFAGRVVARMLDTGALAREGSSSAAVPVVTIAREGRLRLPFDVPELLTTGVAVGDPVRVRLDAFPGDALSGVIARLAGALDPSTRAMRAEVDIDNADGRVRAGMYASVTLTTPPLRDAVTIPARALRGTGDERYCLVVEEGVLRRRPVTVAANDGRSALIARGLAAGDEVCLSAPTLVGAGDSVEAVAAEVR